MIFKAITDIGKIRKHNEDYIFSSDSQIGKLPNLFIVADGMGGHNGGEVASKLGVETIVSCCQSTTNDQPKDILKEAIEQANLEVFKLSNSDSSLSGMGTTVVCCSIFDDEIIVANVGDSRLYTITESDISQETRDHTVVEEMLRVGSISKPQAKTHPKRHMITRAIGAMETVNIDFYSIKRQGNSQILMSTDGLTNMVEDEDLKKIITRNDTIDTKGSKLLDMALENGGEDNISFILIELGE